jgi:prepilin-type N-terminal cleavage/methylation domain-containing protein
MKRISRGFSLIEVLVVITIVGLLVALLLSAAQAARSAARRAQCQQNLRQLAIGMTSYAGAIGTLPPLINGKRGYSALAMILPYIDEPSLYNAVNFDIDRGNLTAARTVVNTFVCPADLPKTGKIASTNYACNAGYGYQVVRFFNGMFAGSPGGVPISLASVTDGTSTTVLMAEWITGSGRSGVGDKRGFTYFVKPLVNQDEFNLFVETCKQPNGVSLVNVFVRRGEGWIKRGFGRSLHFAKNDSCRMMGY